MPAGLAGCCKWAEKLHFQLHNKRHLWSFVHLLHTAPISPRANPPRRMASATRTQKALKISGPGTVELVESCPIPQPRDDEILVRVICVALNPVDAKSADMSPSLGATVGCDFAGEVVAVGPMVTKALSIGDAVCGCAFGNNPDERDNGAFAEYVCVPGELVIQIPPGMSFATAATLGVGLATVTMALYQALKLPPPGTPPPRKPGFVLVYGGGTATGTLAIQMIRKSGMIPVVVCSPGSWARLSALGAAASFDYRSPSCGSDIRAYTDNSLEYVLDCISDAASIKACYAAISSGGGRYISLDPFPIRGHTRRSVRPNWIIALTMLGRPINWQRPFLREPKPKHRQLAQEVLEMVQDLVDRGEIQPHPHEVRSGGLSGVIDGLDLVRKGKLSGKKLVYPVAAET
jgi:aspyridone synthetase trans-acting enoyl reductase